VSSVSTAPGPRLLWLFGAAAALAAPACLKSENNPDPAPCFPGDVGDPDSGVPGGPALQLVVGTEDASHTRVGTVWQDGDHVALVRGGQGGFMIRPALDVTAAAALPAEADGTTCVGVLMTPHLSPSGSSQTRVGEKLKPTAGTSATYHIPPLFGLLSSGSSLDGTPVLVTLDVKVAGVAAGRAEVTVVPDSTVN